MKYLIDTEEVKGSVNTNDHLGLIDKINWSDHAIDVSLFVQPLVCEVELDLRCLKCGVVAIGYKIIFRDSAVADYMCSECGELHTIEFHDNRSSSTE